MLDQLDKMPPLAVVVFGITVGIFFVVRYMGISAGKSSTPSSSQSSAQVAAVIVDPTALNNATQALKEHTECLGEVSHVLRDAGGAMARMAIEMDRIREELRIQRELSRAK